MCRFAEAGANLWMDPKRLSVAILDAFNDACTIYYEKGRSYRQSRKGSETKNEDGLKSRENGPAPILRSLPLSLAKALKNPAELEGMRQAHLRCCRLQLCAVSFGKFGERIVDVCGLNL